ncbi:leukocyte immunoglobulin-like receptor subfamily B member 3 isoform X2 [Manis javanica]|uniref:leukocyte immunoglobulin-like receptor subfamily B member 3 isoform X2 n=1 Tax=Manis javanica TaxID=9974 RepID=UPI003C6CDF0A
MGGSASTTTLATLLCLGTLPKPSIWADPGSVVTNGSPVTIHCQGPPQAVRYSLYKEYSGRWTLVAQDEFRDEASFPVGPMSAHRAGRYQCGFHSRSGSEWSDPLALVVTGVYDPPSLWADPSPVVASGGTVSLRCRSEFTGGTFHLLKEGGADGPQHVAAQPSARGWQARFHVDPVTTSRGGTYRCYSSPMAYPYVWSHPSGPLALEVTGVYKAPSLSARPGALVPSGHSLTLQCRSEAGFDRFALTKEGLPTPQRLDGQPSPDFPLGQANGTYGGRYRCYGAHNVSHVWSAPSAPLDILVTGMSEKPSLSVQPGPSVSWGETVTLQCLSELWGDSFHLSKEGSPAPPQHLRGRDTAAPFRASFTLSPVTSAHGGTYRCYSSNSSSPFLLSHPSDPLGLRVSAPGLEWPVLVLVGVSAACALLLAVLLLLLLRRQRLRRRRKPGAAAIAPKDRGPQSSSGPTADDQEETLYEVVKDTQPEDDRQLASQARASEEPQVTYAELNHLTLGQATRAPPPSQPGEPPAEPSVYAALATR